ncbi:MAG: DUF5110 domain-containing protein [Gemmatimonadetes bacterium]|nr:DUF5110 domain-containing protein [Gemmatimonadota bacterium]
MDLSPPATATIAGAIILVLIVAIVVLGATGAFAQPVAEEIGDGIVRFHASAAAREADVSSVAMHPFPGRGATAPADFPVRVRFQRIGGRAAARIDTEPGTSLYGQGEVPPPLLRNGTRTTAWNFDAFGWGANSENLYQSHPWILAVRADGTAYGVLFDTTYRLRMDLSRKIVAVADGPEFPVVVIDRDSPQDVLRAMADLTGHPFLPPRWAMGYHQCRYSYDPDARVREIADEFRRRDIPCTVIWMDIDYMDGFRSFTFDPVDFPDPRGLNDYLHERGFRAVWMIDPGIMRDPGYDVFDSGTDHNVWVRQKDGAPYVGNVWPGPCVFPDFTNAAVRDWWGDQYREFMDIGVDGVWNDMNEPAVFNTNTKTMPLTNRHDADADLGGPGTHDRYHNIYGMQMARGTWDGIRKLRPEKRPFVLTRANHLGGHRWAATWTGDNRATWWHLHASVASVLNLGLSGQPLAGPDIGGFSGPASPELFARWMGLGALLPFARGHTEKGQHDKEPWSFGKDVEQTCRRALKRRSRLVPHFYTLAHEAATAGLPIARPVFFADPADPALRDVEDAFLLGDGLLVLPRTGMKSETPDVRLPGTWRRIHLAVDDDADPDLPELRLRGGAILPLGPPEDFVRDDPAAEIELLVSLDDEGNASGLLYEDAGDGWAYQDGEYRITRYEAISREGTVHLTATVVDGAWAPADRPVRVRLFTETGEHIAVGRSASLPPVTP